MSFGTLFAVFIVIGYSVIYPALAAQPDLVVGILPSAGTPVEILAKRAQFGSRIRSLEGTLVRPPGYDFFLCERFRTNFDVNENGEVNLVTLPPYQKPAEGNSTVMLVPRGECSFERKAYAAKHFYGAKGILIYDRLGARYTWNENTNSVSFPQAILDYECGNGVSMMYDLPLDPPAYNEVQLDPLMGLKTKMPRKPTNTATTSDEELSKEGSNLGPRVGLCDLENTARNPCESQLCLVTSHVENSTEYPVCCAWDTPVTMPYADDATDLNTDDILAVWLTIRQSELLLGSNLLSSGAEVSIKRRGSSSAFNITYIFMWIWATLLMMVGAWYSAGDYRRFKAKLTAYKKSEDKKQTNDRDDGNRRARRKKSGQPSEHPNGESYEPASVEKNSIAKDERRKHSNGRESDLESGTRSYQIEMDGNVVGKSAQPANRKQQNLKPKKGGKSKPEQNNEVWSLRSLPPPERKRKQKRPLRNKSEQSDNNPPNTEEEVGNQLSIVPARESGTITPFELNQWHVVGEWKDYRYNELYSLLSVTNFHISLAFVVIMSSQLILLYFVPKANTIFFIFYGLACAGAASYLIVDPLINTTIPKFGSCWVEEFNKPVICGCNGFNVTSHLITYTWVGVWIWYGITHYRPETNAFFWITLDILGACLCILVISVLKLTSIKIATMLMVAIFLYDIFFVFITPFLTGGVSVMLRVATGSGNPNGEDFCYKYPDDRFCKGIGFLPMLFILPKANDYANGSVILGLGDILCKFFTRNSHPMHQLNYESHVNLIIVNHSARFSYCFQFKA